jgi:hypothetical protein
MGRSKVLIAVSVVLTWALAWTALLPAATIADSAIFDVIKRTDPGMVNQKVLYRNMVAPSLDLVIAMGSPAGWGLDSPVIWWGEKQKLGLFLQEQARPDMVYSLAIAPGFLDCGARIERATSTETVISCIGEKAYQGLNQKFVYDVRTRALVSHFEYQPFPMLRVFAESGAKSGGAVFVGSDTKRLAAVEFKPGGSPEFRILPDAEAAPWLGRVNTEQGWVGAEQFRILYVLPDDPVRVPFGPSGAFTFTTKQGVVDNNGDNLGKQYPLPQSTFDDFAKSRPQRVKDNYVRENTIIEESIGPVQTEVDKLWFGKTFYDGEGNSGVGGFGYFDASDRQYRLFTPPQLADCSVSAIRVEPDAVWLGIVQLGEYGGSPKGVLRYDRKTATVRRYALADAVYGFSISGNRILIATGSGIAVIEGDQVQRYFVDLASDGGLRFVEAVR